MYIKDITKCDFVPLEFLSKSKSCSNQDQDFILNFNTRTTFYVWKTPTKFCSDPQTLSKMNVFTDGTHRQTDGPFF